MLTARRRARTANPCSNPYPSTWQSARASRPRRWNARASRLGRPRSRRLARALAGAEWHRLPQSPGTTRAAAPAGPLPLPRCGSEHSACPDACVSSRAGVPGARVDSLALRAKGKAVVAVIWRMASGRLRGRTRERPAKRVSLSPVPPAGGSSDSTNHLDHPDLGLSRSTGHHSRACHGAHGSPGSHRATSSQLAVESPGRD
jgi:hypothetical protein